MIGHWIRCQCLPPAAVGDILG
jgi:hypothetical protein